MLNLTAPCGLKSTGKTMIVLAPIEPAKGRLILSQVASGLNLTVNERSPIVEGEFPLDGSRFEGTFPPIVGPGPSFSLRKKASRVFTLQEWLVKELVAGTTTSRRTLRKTASGVILNTISTLTIHTIITKANHFYPPQHHVSIHQS